MTDNSIISIKTVQSAPGAEPYDIEMTCDGEYVYGMEKSIIKYKEPEGSGLGNTVTTIEMDNNSVTITRCGENNSRMFFKENEIYKGVYEMPFGMFTIHINSERVEIASQSDGAHFMAEYTMELEGVVASHNKIELDVKRKI